MSECKHEWIRLIDGSDILVCRKCLIWKQDWLEKQVAELTVRAEQAEATVKALAENAKQDTELLEKILGGALKESCVYRNNNLVDWTFHCCDWSEVAEEIAKRLGINLEENERGGSES